MAIIAHVLHQNHVTWTSLHWLHSQFRMIYETLLALARCGFVPSWKEDFEALRALFPTLLLGPNLVLLEPSANADNSL